MLFAAVCGKDGKEYNSLCLAACAGIDVDYKGLCAIQSSTANKPSCTCTPDIDPGGC